MTILEHFEFNFFAVLARYELSRRHGTAFQDFFVELGRYRWAPDFEGRRPQGRLGDKKCDGYRPADGSVFQCYAPRVMQPRPLCKKIAEDFLGALAHSSTTPISRWILVHNDPDDLPTEAHELVIRLRGRRRTVPIEIWGPETLLSTIMELPRTSLMLLFPSSLSALDLRRINYRDIDELIESLGELTSPSFDGSPEAPSPKKIAHNGFSDEVAGLLRAGSLIEPRFTSYFADTSRAVVGNVLAEKFKRLYSEASGRGEEADEIFFSLADAVGGLGCAKPRRAAIIGLIAYMFHTCEIFENAPSDTA